MKASDAAARFLAAHDIHHCFELVGGMITHLLDSLAQHGKCSIISMHHEQAAAFAAEGLARQAKGARVGLAMGTSGPGATNLITGIGSCWFDSVPCLFVTGQVNTSELKGEVPVRQQGFQELDIVCMVSTVTKYAAQVTSAEQLLPELHRALSLAQSGRKGPVLLDIPNNVQRADIPDELVQSWISRPLDIYSTSKGIPGSNIFEPLKALCRAAIRPLVLIGGGARWSTRLDDLLVNLENLHIPYVSTLLGCERTPAGDCNFGMIGTYGNRTANWAIQNADLLIVLGARLDVRQTGSDTSDFARNAKIVQIDIDPAQLNNRVQADLSLELDMDSFLDAFQFRADVFPVAQEAWKTSLDAKRREFDVDEYQDWPVSPHRLLNRMNDALSGMAVDYVCDVGNHQMWAAQDIRLEKNQALHHSGGMGAMGFAFPVAIGTSLASGNKAVVLTGDGGMQINIQELDTLARLSLDVTIIVFNNMSLGMVKNFQDMYFDGRNQSTLKGYSSPSFAKVAEAYGIPAIAINSEAELTEAYARMKQSKSPLLIEILMPNATECRPRLTFGGKLDDQYPHQITSSL